jgi:hypothetical protein
MGGAGKIGINSEIISIESPQMKYARGYMMIPL